MPVFVVMSRALLRRRSRYRFSRSTIVCFGLFALLFGLAHAAPDSPSVIIPHGAQSGDLIFRKGTEPVSELVRLLDSDYANARGRGEFSHVGILIAASELSAEFFNSDGASALHDSSWLVLHATPSELEDRPDSVVLDSFLFFTSPNSASPLASLTKTAPTARSSPTPHG